MRVSILREPVAAISHFVGAMAAVVGLVVLVLSAQGDPAKVAGASVYGGSLVMLFSASASYHFFDLGRLGNEVLKRLDHVAIYLLIAGTYTPMLIILTAGAWRITMLSLVGGLAILGAIFELAWRDAPRWLSVALYLALGWIILIPAYLIFPQLDGDSLFWLVSGGLLYTVGSVVYARKWPDPWPPWIGFHEIWHLFVLFAAVCHFVFVMSLLAYPRVSF